MGFPRVWASRALLAAVVSLAAGPAMGAVPSPSWTTSRFVAGQFSALIAGPGSLYAAGKGATTGTITRLDPVSGRVLAPSRLGGLSAPTLVRGEVWALASQPGTKRRPLPELVELDGRSLQLLRALHLSLGPDGGGRAGATWGQRRRPAALPGC